MKNLGIYRAREGTCRAARRSGKGGRRLHTPRMSSSSSQKSSKYGKKITY